MLKQFTKKLISQIGYTYYKHKYLPFGVDLALDIQRFLGEQANLNCIFDVGAHYGETAKYYAAHFPNATIHSFEPTKNNYSILVENCQKLPRVKAWQLGLSDHSGSSQILTRENSQENSIVRASDSSQIGTIETINLTTVQEFARAQNITYIDILKTDTEGYDTFVLRGAEELLKSKSISFIFSEVTFVPQEKYQTQFTDLLHILDTYGYKFVDIYDHYYADMSWPRRPPVSFANALFCRDDLFSTPPPALRRLH